MAEHNNNRAYVGISGLALNKKEFPKMRWVVPGLLPEGFTILGGRPKVGKSWLLMNVSIAVALGGCALGAIECPEGDVLHLALEDNQRRLQERQRVLAPNFAPSRVEWNVDWPGGEAALTEIEKWMKTVANPRLVMMDTWKQIRRPPRPNESIYDWDYDSARPFREFANNRKIAIVAAHHLNKRIDADDPFDQLSGSNGLSGAADTIFVIRRDGTGGHTLYGRGRDVSEFSRALTMSANGEWKLEGDASIVRASRERANILAFLANNLTPATPADIAIATRQKPGNVRFLLLQMVKDGQVIKPERGLYTVPHYHH